MGKKDKLICRCLTIKSELQIAEQNLIFLNILDDKFAKIFKPSILEYFQANSSYVVVSHISKITEDRNGCNIFLIKRYIEQNIKKICIDNNECYKKLELAKEKILNIESKYNNDIKVYIKFKDQGISHLEKKYSNSGKRAKMYFNRLHMQNLINDIKSVLILILKDHVSGLNFKTNNDAENELKKMIKYCLKF